MAQKVKSKMQNFQPEKKKIAVLIQEFLEGNVLSGLLNSYTLSLTPNCKNRVQKALKAFHSIIVK